jgi:hypothetical protein
LNNFLNSVRKIEFIDPLNSSQTKVGIRIFTLDGHETYLTYQGAYLPYEGFIEGNLMLTRPLDVSEKLKITFASMLGSAVDTQLWSEEIGPSNGTIISFNIDTFQKYQSELAAPFLCLALLESKVAIRLVSLLR